MSDAPARVLLDLPINPAPLARPRTVPAGRGVRTYTPDPEGFKDAFGWAVKSCHDRPKAPMVGDLSVMMRLWRRHRPGARGDIDNLEKAILDAGNGLLWRDDRQIVECSKSIEAAGPDVKGRILLIVRPFDRAAIAARMAETRKRFTPLHDDLVKVPRLMSEADQVLTGLREWLDLTGCDLDDPIVARTVSRVVDLFVLQISLRVKPGLTADQIAAYMIHRAAVALSTLRGDNP